MLPISPSQLKKKLMEKKRKEEISGQRNGNWRSLLAYPHGLKSPSLRGRFRARGREPKTRVVGGITHIGLHESQGACLLCNNIKG